MMIRCVECLTPSRASRILGIEFTEEALSIDGIVLLWFTCKREKGKNWSDYQRITWDDFLETFHPTVLSLLSSPIVIVATIVVILGHSTNHHNHKDTQNLNRDSLYKWNRHLIVELYPEISHFLGQLRCCVRLWLVDNGCMLTNGDHWCSGSNEQVW